MAFASITILLRKIKIESNVAKYAIFGGTIGIILGTYCVLPYVSASNTRLIFTLMLTSFGIALFLKNFVYQYEGKQKIENFKLRDAAIIICIGVFGGVFSSLIGTGIHFIIFSFVTLLYRLDEKVATPTSVLIMASDSIFGFVFRKFIVNDFSSQALEFWMLCIPVVALCAPLGAIACSKVNRVFIVKFLMFLILLEFSSTLFIFKFNTYSILISIGVIILSFAVYLTMIRLSKQMIENSCYCSLDKRIHDMHNIKKGDFYM